MWKSRIIFHESYCMFDAEMFVHSYLKWILRITDVIIDSSSTNVGFARYRAMRMSVIVTLHPPSPILFNGKTVRRWKPRWSWYEQHVKDYSTWLLDSALLACSCITAPAYSSVRYANDEAFSLTRMRCTENFKVSFVAIHHTFTYMRHERPSPSKSKASQTTDHKAEIILLSLDNKSADIPIFIKRIEASWHSTL